MPREVVSEQQLRVHINAELRRHNECEDTDFQGPIWRLKGVGSFGENWSADTLTFHGRPADNICGGIFLRILEAAAKRFTVDWPE